MFSNLAGSAIKQGLDVVGRIDRWSTWNPTPIKTKWLLLSGASDPPGCIQISNRRTRDILGMEGGTFLSGCTSDLVNMEDAVRKDLRNAVRDINQTKSTARDHIQKFFHECRDNKVKPVLYYTGHGENGTGNWCFADGTISIQEILDMCPERSYYPMIFSDTCYSGHWANFCLKKKLPGLNCLAACPEFSKALDTKGKGGDLTLFMTGKKPRPSTEPLYSGGNRNLYPITLRYDLAGYYDFINSHLFSSEDILVSQNFNNGRLSCIFAPMKHYSPRPAFSCAFLNDHKSLVELVKRNGEQKDSNGKSKQIYSLACDENLGFAVFFLADYGSAQIIVTNTLDVKKNMKLGYKITACTAKGATFYIIMTKDTKQYNGQQEWFTSDTWGKAEDLIKKHHDKGRIITGICYCSGQRKYLVVVTETEISNQQDYRRFRFLSNLNKWVEEQGTVGFHPTIIFMDPNEKQTLAVLIKDGTKPRYTCIYDFKVDPKKSL